MLWKVPPPNHVSEAHLDAKVLHGRCPEWVEGDEKTAIADLPCEEQTRKHSALSTSRFEMSISSLYGQERCRSSINCCLMQDMDVLTCSLPTMSIQKELFQHKAI